MPAFCLLISHPRACAGTEFLSRISRLFDIQHILVVFITDRPIRRDSKACKPSSKAWQPYYFCAISFLINMGWHSRRNNRAENSGPRCACSEIRGSKFRFRSCLATSRWLWSYHRSSFDVPRGKKDKLTAVCISSHLSNEPCFSPFVDFDKAGSNITGSFRKEYQSKHLMGRTKSQAWTQVAPWHKGFSCRLGQRSKRNGRKQKLQ